MKDDIIGYLERNHVEGSTVSRFGLDNALTDRLVPILAMLAEIKNRQTNFYQLQNQPQQQQQHQHQQQPQQQPQQHQHNMFTWSNGKVRRAPEGFEFPKVSLAIAWQLNLLGDLEVGPFKLLEKT